MKYNKRKATREWFEQDKLTTYERRSSLPVVIIGIILLMAWLGVKLLIA